MYVLKLQVDANVLKLQGLMNVDVLKLQVDVDVL